MRKFNHLLVAVAATSALIAVGCSDSEREGPSGDAPINAIEEMTFSFDRVKVFVPKSEADSKILRDAKNDGLSLTLFSKSQLTSEYTDFSHAYQLTQQPNGAVQLEEIEQSLEEALAVEHKQHLTLWKEEGKITGFKSIRDGIGAHAACRVEDADATDPTLATRYMLCQGNLLVIEKDIPKTDEADAEVGAEEVEVVAENDAE